jgi:hypothetical protein
MESSDETNIREFRQLDLLFDKRPRSEGMSEKYYASPEIKDIPRKLLALPAISVDTSADQTAPLNTDESSSLPSIHEALEGLPGFDPPPIYPNSLHAKAQSNTSPSQTIGEGNPLQGPFIKKSSDGIQDLEMLVLEWTNLTREEILVF